MLVTRNASAAPANAPIPLPLKGAGHEGGGPVGRQAWPQKLLTGPSTAG